MAATAWPAVMNALVTLARGMSGYQAPTAAGSLIPVYDSVEVGLTNDIPSTLLVIGWIGDPDDAPTDPGQSTQGIATLGTSHHRTETGTVACMAIARTGDALLGTSVTDAGSIGAARAQAFAVIDALDVALRANPSLGLVGATHSAVVAYIDAITSVQTWLNEGCVVRIEFTVTFTARI